MIGGQRFVVSAFRGQPAGNDPFGAATLEWATTSPPPPYNFVAVPYVTSAYPRWDVPEAPTAVTGAASAVTQSSATLNATVNPNGQTVTDCHFNYGTTTAYESSAPCSKLPGSGTEPVAVSAPVSGLSANTTYHFQVVATNATGTSEGADQAFTTANPPEFGRCVKVAKGVKGKYSNSTCTSPADRSWRDRAVARAVDLVRRAIDLSVTTQ